ncbi:hypothetical protein [Roseateles sp. PN1]|uniref:hypothetical protein n=1 Tax=Roseateles sp. PN1 TaxID=3137372 RepID=UPI00313A384F
MVGDLNNGKGQLIPEHAPQKTQSDFFKKMGMIPTVESGARPCSMRVAEARRIRHLNQRGSTEPVFSAVQLVLLLLADAAKKNGAKTSHSTIKKGGLLPSRPEKLRPYETALQQMAP